MPFQIGEGVKSFDAFGKGKWILKAVVAVGAEAMLFSCGHFYMCPHFAFKDLFTCCSSDALLYVPPVHLNFHSYCHIGRTFVLKTDIYLPQV